MTLQIYVVLPVVNLMIIAANMNLLQVSIGPMHTTTV